MNKDKTFTGLYLECSLLENINGYLEQSDCRSRNEFINRAIRHYIAFLQKENNSEFLTPALESVLSGLIGDTENRLARVLFKLAVELSMNLHVTASQSGITENELDGLRRLCVDEVKRLNGRISFKNAHRYQKN